MADAASPDWWGERPREPSARANNLAREKHTATATRVRRWEIFRSTPSGNETPPRFSSKSFSQTARPGSNFAIIAAARLRQHRHAILAALATAHDDLIDAQNPCP